jgi:hypothetical protein
MNPRKMLGSIKDRDLTPEERDFLVSVVDCAKSMRKSMELLSKVSRFRQTGSYVNQDRVRIAKTEIKKASEHLSSIQSISSANRKSVEILKNASDDIDQIVIQLGEISQSEDGLVDAVKHLLAASKIIRKTALKIESLEKRGVIMTCLTSINAISRRLEGLSTLGKEKSAIQTLRAASDRISNIPGVGALITKKRR